ncbi:glycosyl hydrolase [Polaribacter sp. L3A8]|uniref:glycosyl hydrolase n=1 Tax=Polaribacter sp. L3A8 TaxID=2686361 RepID=UPI00131D04FE|nr:glycosyl hydrolase [Polaribacter sp. L3A8]
MNKIKILIGILLIGMSSYSQKQENPISEQLFKNPSPENRPRTWMHAMSGNMSKVGLTKDLEAIADVGIGGIILFNVTHYVPKGKVIFNSDEHIEMTAHAAAECERLGLSFGVHNCDGWTSSGGPWVAPEHAMKRVTYNQTIVNGGNVKLQLETPSQRGGFYKDVAVLAYPALASDIEDYENKATLKSSQKSLKLNLLVDQRIDVETNLEGTQKKPQWIDFNYGKPFTMNSLAMSFYQPPRKKGKIYLKTSEDGITYKIIKEIKPMNIVKYERAVELDFNGITSKYFRIESEVPLQLTEISLSNLKRINNTLARTSLFKIENYKMPTIKNVNPSSIINKDEVINLTAFMDDKGTLNANLPKGKWTIMRFGYTITAAFNVPASEEGTGWEVDKMSRESFKIFYDGYVRNVIDATRAVAPNALQYTEIDSYEVGGQNWTKNYEQAFKKELGYDLVSFLPLYAGKYVDNKDTSDQVLWDIRNFNSKMITDNYFDYFTELCHEDGLISYVEPYSFNGDFNELDAARKVDITMGEFWMHQRYQAGTAVSGARIYGKNVVSAEAFSARPEINWKGHPGSLKLTGDKAWTLGINEFMFHRFAHQANTHVKPGMTMSQWGSHIDRTQTWWYNAGSAWFKYLARGQYMLRKGIPVSDLLVFVGDGSPNSIIKEHMFSPALPKHINYDCINADALLHRVEAKENKMVLPNGIQYQALYLKNIKEIKLKTLKRIAELANKGVVIIGEKPQKLGSYAVSEKDNIEFNKLVDQIWTRKTTYLSGDWDTIFKANNISTDLFIEGGKDINYTHRKTENEDVYFFYNPENEARTYLCTFNIEGKIPELWNQMTGEVTKLAAFTSENGQTKALISLPAEGSVFVVFRESSKGIQSILPKSLKSNEDVTTTLTNDNTIEVEVKANGNYNFKLNDGSLKAIKIKNLPEQITVLGTWSVDFPDIKAKEKNFSFPKLIDWTSHKNEQIKYYSGTAIYKNEFVVGKNYLEENNKVTIDLGVVNIAAKVIVNGKDLGISWMSPYVLDVTKALVKGKNTIQIEVTNQWTNRLIGDENFPSESGMNRKNEYMPDWYLNNEPPPLKQRSTFTTFPFYKKGDETIPAGLVGPVVLKVSRIIEK